MTRTLLVSFLLILGSNSLRCPDGTGVQNGTCVKCSPGYYRQASRQSDKTPNFCLPCPAGTKQGAYGAMGPDLCHLCWPGTYSDKNASTHCVNCPSGKTSSYGASKCDTCPPGSFIVLKKGGCQKCPRGTYATETNSLECTPCPNFWCTPKVGARSIRECKPCRRGPEYPRCLNSQYFEYYNPDNVSEWDVKWQHCRDCPSGTGYTGKEPINAADQCTPCGIHRYRNAAHFTDVRLTCEGCPVGLGLDTYSNRGMFCRKKNEPCPPDMYESEGDCKFCDRGYRFIPEEKRCEQCPAGLLSKGGISTKCFKCPNNMRPDRNQRRCTCGAGTFLKDNRCIPCPIGTESTFPDHRFTKCYPCDRGIAVKEGTVRCKPCPVGLVEDPSSPGTKCAPCPKGLIPSDFGTFFGYARVSHDYCVSPQTNCPPGTRRSVSSYGYFHGCEDIFCSRESKESDLGVTCKGCPLGAILKESGPGCDYCPPDAVSDGGLATKCTACTLGKARSWSGDTCACMGSIRRGWGMQDGLCKKCPPGTYNLGDDEICKPCRANQISKGYRCRGCPPYKIPSDDKTRCVDCPPGTTPNRRSGADKCI